MNQRRRRILLVLALLLLSGVGLLSWLMQPQRLAPLLLNMAGNALGLDIIATGTSEYRLRGTPQLILRNVEARQTGTSTPMLSAQRILIAVPWSTLRSGGASLTAIRLELDQPRLNLAAFQRWQAQRPAQPTRLPTLTQGMRITRGHLQGQDWTLENIDLRIPRLVPGQPLHGRLHADYRDTQLRMPMALSLHLRRLDEATGLGLAGTLAPAGSTWQLPLQLRLSGYLRTASARLDHLTVAAHARYQSGASQQTFALGLAGGRLSFSPGLQWQDAALALRGQDAVPSLDARGNLALDDALQVDWQGHLAAWPASWPALPAPLSQSNTALPFRLNYHGTANLADIAHLRLQRDSTRFDARFRLFEIMDWLETSPVGQASPLPPLSGRLTTPRLLVSGAVLEGVELHLDDPALPATPSPP